MAKAKVVLVPKELRHKNRIPFKVKWEMWKQPCSVCGSDYRTAVDHIIPLAQGGTNDRDNLQTLCQPCNSFKGSRKTDAELREWYAANKSKIDALRREQEFYRYTNDYGPFRPIPAEYKSCRQRTEAGE